MRNRKPVTFAAIFAGLVLIAFLTLLFMGLTAARPDHLGVVDGRLADVPDSPNCVSTQATDDSHRIDPIPFTGSADTALTAIRNIVSEMSGSRIVEQNDHYLYAEFRSTVFRFPDDVEFLVDSDQSVIHFRSASRVGHSDLGVNRARMEEIRRRYQAASP
ncbi:MAG: DUF1499 domain-containing protein [Planctomycetaceae bacterium]